MKVSIITSILDSHEIVRRQILHYEKIGLPDDVEIIFMDDGSDPPLESDTSLKNFSIIPTNEKRAWTEHLARNKAAKIAKGEYFFFTDIDYIVPLSAINIAREFTGDRMRFVREFGILDKNGNFTQDIDVLKSWGLKRDTVKLGQHKSVYLMHRKIFFELGGYREDRVGTPMPQYVGRDFDHRWKKLAATGKYSNSDTIPTIYFFPNGKFCGDMDYNPFGLFHNLKRR